ncbi:non-homologous end joining protein Ku [Anaeromyxobacter paludicola]|uniref:Non-homologous end joining protein Ku n=1 Tax=Anaeromyxobacter paludicola TaxID=2918171 RepID=A0ABN6N5G4_9BACT|nr:Ku protein [Anaeromyxobacter paludicola]BDG08404.1 non-homologous end joining protein Ku [Anaeromyxobacter paludicola]
MPRAIWSGAVSFGLVNIPVKLYSAVSHKEVRFHMLHDADGSRIELHRVCAAEGKEVPYEHVVKGYEVAPHRYVTVTREELEAADPRGSRTIDIEEFVGLGEIDPIYYDATYHLGPDKGAARPYALLLEAMRRSGKVALGRFVMRTKESLCVLRPMGQGLALSTMNYADEVVPQEDLGLPEHDAPAPRELAMAEQLVGSLAASFDPAKYKDRYREKVLALVEKKAAGEEIVAAPSEQPAKVVNLADALAASLAAARTRKAGPSPEEAPPAGERRHRTAEAAHVAKRKPRKRGNG